MSRYIRVSGEQRAELELERLAHALLQAARERRDREKAEGDRPTEVTAPEASDG